MKPDVLSDVEKGDERDEEEVDNDDVGACQKRMTARRSCSLLELRVRRFQHDHLAELAA